VSFAGGREPDPSQLTPVSNSGIRDNHSRGNVADFLRAKIKNVSPLSVLSTYLPFTSVFRDFGVCGFLCESLGKLESLDRDLQKYTTVFIDESHRSRTEDTQSYEMFS
jgi:hypothetical protein